jgi:lipopolysaccharide biosynthesis glycosyltransferase
LNMEEILERCPHLRERLYEPLDENEGNEGFIVIDNNLWDKESIERLYQDILNLHENE